MEQDIPDKLREMPSAKEAEYALLGSILLEESTIEKAIRYIETAEAFWRTENRRIWECMLTLYKRGEPIEVVTLTALYKDTYDELPDLQSLLQNQHKPINVETYAKLVWHKYLQRTYTNKMLAMNKKSYGTLEEFNEHLLDTEHLIKRIRDSQPTKFIPIEIIARDTVEHIQNKDDILRFNMRILDSFAQGMTKKELTVIGGRPSMGKTSLIVNIAKAMVELGQRVMVMNREMSNIAMMTKLMVLESTLPYSKLRKRDLTEDEWKEIDTTRDLIQKKYTNLMMYDNIRTLEEGLVEIRRHEPDVVIDDFIQLIKPPDSRKDRRFQIEDILNEYKWIAKVQNIPIIVVSQLNRDVDKRILDNFKPKMSDLAEAGTIEQLCENVIFVHRPFVHMPESESPYKVDIIAAKVRYGEVGTHPAGFDGNRCKFYDTLDEALANRL